jgi:hypothetical protein
MFARVLSPVALVAALLIPATAASAAKQPTAKWARKHHLTGSWRAKDPDHDGLGNLAEFKAGTNPRSADTDRDGLADGAELRVGDDPLDGDSDGDGVKDGAEHAGVVTSYDGGTLTIRLFHGGTLTGVLADDVDCPAADDSADSSDDDGDVSGDDASMDDSSDDGADASSVDDSADDVEVDAGSTCEDAGLETGALVREVELEREGGRLVFTAIELA